MQLDKFLIDIFGKTGVDATDPRIIELLGHAEINRINVHDDMAKLAQQGLISIESATKGQGHPAIRKHYYGQHMNYVEEALEEVFQQYGFTPEEIAEINKEERAPRRVPLAVAKLKAKLAGAEGEDKGKGKGESEELKRKVNDLNEALAKEKAEREKDRKDHTGSLAQFKKDIKLNALLGKHKTTFDNLPEEVKLSTLKTLLSKSLQDKDAMLELDENDNWVLKMKDGTNFYSENQTQVKPEDFISKVFADNKVLQQNQAAAGTNGATAESHGQPAGAAGGQQKNTKYAGVFDEAIQALDRAPVSVV